MTFILYRYGRSLLLASAVFFFWMTTVFEHAALTLPIKLLIYLRASYGIHTTLAPKIPINMLAHKNGSFRPNKVHFNCWDSCDCFCSAESKTNKKKSADKLDRYVNLLCIFTIHTWPTRATSHCCIPFVNWQTPNIHRLNVKFFSLRNLHWLRLRMYEWFAIDTLASSVKTNGKPSRRHQMLNETLFLSTNSRTIKSCRSEAEREA